ncbi:hypothetical protein OTU49_012268 [Cherax quadricarinatus]|uniref:Cyclin-dependent kinase inhibitor domain-containing protein n=1 Tax=Cherax quadricarinatus TaxID=27406 RepID=A0AAW0W042_CHEQU
MSLQRLLNNRMLELRRQFLGNSLPNQDRTVHFIRRNLFGPVDHEHNLKFAHEEMAKIQQADCKRWNFDFEEDKPREGDYDWQTVREAVPQTQQEAVPQTHQNPAFTCSTCTTTTCLTSTTCLPTSTCATTCPTPYHSSCQLPSSNNKGVKRLQSKVTHKVTRKLCTDYYTERKTLKQVDRSRLKLTSELLDSNNCVNTKISELLKVKSTNTK